MGKLLFADNLLKDILEEYNSIYYKLDTFEEKSLIECEYIIRYAVYKILTNPKEKEKIKLKFVKFNIGELSHELISTYQDEFYELTEQLEEDTHANQYGNFDAYQEV